MYRFFETYARNHSYGYINASTMKLPYTAIIPCQKFSNIIRSSVLSQNLFTTYYVLLIKLLLGVMHVQSADMTQQNTFHLSQMGH